MRRRLFQLLAIVVALALTTSFGTTKEVELWFVPMSQEGPQKAPVLKWIKENLPKLLPQGVTVSDNYGPPIYQDAQQKFIVQGRRGKPDVIEGVLEGMIAYQRGGLLAPLDDYFGKWPDKSQFIQSTLKALTINGKLYGVPYNTNVRVLLYRKDLFQKYSLNPPKTWDDMLQAAATISAKEKGVAGLGLTTKSGSVRTFQEFISWFFQVNAGENPYKYDDAAKKWTLNTTPEKLAQVLKLYNDIFFGANPSAANQNTRGNDYQATDTDYVSGKSAMVPMGPWIYANRTTGDVAKKILEEETGVAPLPLPSGGTQATYLEVKPIMINANSKEKDAAWEVIKVLAGKDFVALENKLEGVNPPRQDVADLPDFKNDWWQQAFVTQLPTGVALAPINWGLVVNDLTEALQKVIYKNSTAEDTAKELYNTLDQRAKNNQL
ncbi:MAG TPA: sugar ABC transporter substrate-binding protein [Chthoniobacterales bacterium]|jgi:multiple sugar transport system substrate-binding protein|nr:sugar ABC transporter substrate-binding protein [Chthoniobacterales bacterium]